MRKRYDHIIVGAGSAGGVLAARLAEDEHRSILLLEAGADYTVPDLMPDAVRYAYGADTTIWDSGHIWNFRARATDQVEIDVPRGKVTGGSSAVNDAQFLRGMPEDFDRWAEWGNPEWRFESSFRTCCSWSRARTFETSFTARGPVTCRRDPAEEWGPQQHAFFRACLDAGFSHCPDHNRPGSTGVGPLAFNVDGRVRVSTAIAYPDSVRHRPGLAVISHSLVHGVIFEGPRAVGVRAMVANTESEFYGDEVILCAGAIGTPHILAHLGVGPADQLRRWTYP